MKKFLYNLFFLFWFLLSLLPLRLLYVLSDLLYYPLYYCVRYRRPIVRQNLIESFPEKDIREIIAIERDFYSYFCDYVVETIKMFSMGEAQLRKRLTFGGIDRINEILKDRDCVVYMGHYCNWEWVSSLPLHLDASNNVLSGQIYHRLANESFDKLFFRMRARFGAVGVEMYTALRQIVRFKQDNQRFIIGFISDQSPMWDSIKMWTDFLNHKSSFFVGGERLAQLTNAHVSYLDIRRVKRGYYHAEFVPITDNPKAASDYEITIAYARLLEQTIRREPRYWLWTHKRWKRTYEEYLKNYAGKQNP